MFGNRRPAFAKAPAGKAGFSLQEYNVKSPFEGGKGDVEDCFVSSFLAMRVITLQVVNSVDG